VLTDEEPVIVRDAAGVWMPQASQSPTKSRADTVVLREQILRAAAIHSLDPYLVKAVAWAESRFNPLAVSPAKAVGMMQVMPATASNLGLRTVDSTPLNQLLKDPWVSLLVGTRYLSQQLTRFNGRMDLALAAYNAGPAAVERAGMRIPNYPETQNYVRSVLTYYVAEKKARTLERLSG
jgi:soluble lytic murein transglycosylase-like protein